MNQYKNGARKRHLEYGILPSNWEQSYAAEAAIRVSEFTFEKLNANKICAAHAQSNIQSKRVIEKMGMRHV